MFCDLVGSTTLAEGLDPEDLREIISSFHGCATGIIQAAGGHVARYMGDGVLAYFGYPVAHENDAECAIRAALELTRTIGTLRSGSKPLRIRIGIATGLVVVGDQVKTIAADRPPIIGETPNLAARLQAVAEPDTIVIAPTTKRLTGGLFEYRDLGRLELKGMALPVHAWQVLAEGSVTSRFDALRMSTTALVNREEEIELLLRRWRRAASGAGQIVLLTGEPGIGKSRLIQALRQRLDGEDHTYLSYFGSPYHQNTSLYPVIISLRTAVQLSPADPPATSLDKLETFVAGSGTALPDVAYLFASLLSLPTHERYASQRLGGQRMKDRTLDALLDQLAGLATTQPPVLVVFEDLQWVDQTTLDLLTRTVARIQRLPVMLLMTHRPDFIPPWQGQSHVTTCVLNRLIRRDCESLVLQLTGGKSLPADVLEHILAPCDGVPLCLEELTKTTLETGQFTAEGDRYTRAGPLSQVQIPQTLNDSLMARLDRLGPRKEVAQTAAVIGRRFSHKMLAALLPDLKEPLEQALQQLIAAELVIRHGEPPEAMYTFKHALVRDAAYQTLLRTNRQALHARLARIIEEQSPETVEAEPELLAHHYVGARLAEPAIRYCQKAGEQALQRSANAEAVGHFRKALEQIATLPESPQRDQRELDLQLRVGAALTVVKGFASPEVESAYARARVLCEQQSDSVRLFSVVRGLWQFDLVRANWVEARDLAVRMLALARNESNTAYRLEAHRALGMTSFWLGEFITARAHLEQGRQLYDRRQHHTHALLFGNDPGVACLVHEAYVAWVLGQPDRALTLSTDSIELARQLENPFSLTQALTYRAFLHLHRDEAVEAGKLAAQTIELASEHGFPFWLAESKIVEGWAKAKLGETARGLEQVRKGLDDFLSTGAGMDKPRWLAVLAETYGLNRQPEMGLETLSEALSLLDSTGERLCEARIHHLQAMLLEQSGGPGSAGAVETALETSLAVARRQQARSWELSAATHLARLWHGRGRHAEADALLRPLHDGFSEGHETPDLIAAKAVLDGSSR